MPKYLMLFMETIDVDCLNCNKEENTHDGCNCRDFGRVRRIEKSDNQLRHVCPSFRLPAWNN
jgi:hypothetical protein